MLYHIISYYIIWYIYIRNDCFRNHGIFHLQGVPLLSPSHICGRETAPLCIALTLAQNSLGISGTEPETGDEQRRNASEIVVKSKRVKKNIINVIWYVALGDIKPNETGWNCYALLAIDTWKWNNPANKDGSLSLTQHLKQGSHTAH